MSGLPLLPAAAPFPADQITALNRIIAAANAEQRQWLSDTVAQNREALALARQRYQNGVSDFLNVLDAQRSLQQNELTLLASTTATSSDLVNLYRALGGGWSEQSQEPQEPRARQEP